MKIKYLKNGLIAENNFTKIVKKLVKKEQGVAFAETFGAENVDNVYTCAKTPLTNGKTVGEVLKTAKTCGNCYFYALMLAYGMKGATLVHGNLHNLDYANPNGGSYTEFEHAWVETDLGIVLDTTSRTVFQKDAYYKAYGVKESELKKFSKTDLENAEVFRTLATAATKFRPSLREKLSLFPQFEAEKELTK